MKFFSNKFLISFLILAVLFYSFSTKVFEAKGVATIITTIVAVVAVVVIVMVVCQVCAVAVASTIGQSAAVGLVYGGIIGAGLAIIGQVACLAGSNNPMFTGCGGGDTSSQGVAGSPTLQNQTAAPIMSADGNCTTGFTLNYSVTDAYQYGIYRDGNLIKQGTFNTIVQPSPYNTSFSYQDNSLAPNTTYKYSVILTDKDGKQYSYPEMSAYSDCGKIDLKANGSDGPTSLYMPNNEVDLTWTSAGATGCSASGDWTGSKAIPSGSQNLGRLSRGTTNPGQGKTYNFDMTCNIMNSTSTVSDNVRIIVWQYPFCSFTADPTTIILPQTSTLSWSCSYADTCSIDQGIGSVSNVSGSKEVRPSATTTYTLACNGLDGERTWQSTVNVGFTPRVREVAPW